ncbi:hypothetical protein BCLUESOX_831 [bacterium endosymbiont of Bathymodiolus sp. 5 South]|nr:hypothetical protein [uncultured Gammaproteobacteria bacterium]SHN93653.1 hypothetical protein BCLUESOX_831 [bacterium endosymbiont of Bathymodiolus sp. 5 South]VVH58792.1 hypothetical protein BSPCLSOX_1051 [uncultured Gammaproteobacteria bacterium]
MSVLLVGGIGSLSVLTVVLVGGFGSALIVVLVGATRFFLSLTSYPHFF